MTNQLFNDDELNKFTNIYKNLSNDDEFEIMFGGYTKTNSINMKQFLDILKYLKLFADDKKLKIVHTETLDISYNYDNKNFHTYRISVDGVETINKLMSSLQPPSKYSNANFGIFLFAFFLRSSIEGYFKLNA